MKSPFLNRFRWCPVGLLAGSLIAPSTSKATISVLTGQATAGADLGSSSSMSTPPLGRSKNVFYDSRDLTMNPTGRLGAEGWANTYWSISQSAIIASGSSGQGFNGALGAGGWIYGWGHGSFSAAFNLDQTYQYTAANPAQNAKGVTGTNGFLPSGTFTLTGTTYGNWGGFSINVQLVAATPEQNAILSGANATVSD